MEAVCCGVPAPFFPNASVSAVMASPPFGGGNAGERMSEAEISDAVIFISQAFPEHRARYGTTIEQGKSRLRTAACALMQLWRDLEREEQQRKVGQKALA